MTRGSLVGAACLLILVLGAGPAWACDAPPPGAELSVPQTGDIAIGQRAELAFRSFNDSAVVPGSGHFEVDGPKGHLSLPAKDDGGASFVADKVGTYSVTVVWSEYGGCDGGAVEGRAGPKSFDIREGDPPTVSFRTVLRRTQANARGAATIEGFMTCPRVWSLHPTRLAVYYERGAKTPTHDSPHAILNVAKGCGAGTGVGTVRRAGRGFRIEISRGLAAFEVTAPTRMRVLMELSYNGRVLGRTDATFQPSKTGESVKRR